MPYIDQARRRDLAIDPRMEGDEPDPYEPTNPGELNFCITQLLLGYTTLKGAKYQTFNDILGALEGAKLEFYRRIVVNYEQVKCAENGDVYTPPDEEGDPTL